MKKFLFTAAVLCLCMAACDRPQPQGGHLVPEENFKDQMDTIPIQLYTITNGQVLAQVTNYGARVVSLFTPDRNGTADNIIVGHNTLKDYVVARGERYLGAVTGPVTGPISGGSFLLNGKTYQTDKNAGTYTLNGGALGTDKRPWNVIHQSDSVLQMQLILPDGEEGFPGRRLFQVTYAITKSDLMVIIRAFGSDETPLSLTWNPYFNLHGEGEGTVDDHELAIQADGFLPINAEGLPTGDMVAVKESPFDFHEFRSLGTAVKDIKGELDHNWCLTYDQNLPIHEACRLRDPVSGRIVTVLTNRPGLRVSTAGAFDGMVTGANGKPIVRHGAVLLAAQDWPDAVNQLRFPSIFFKPAEYFSSTTIYRFETIE